jgi:transketolase
MRNKFADLIYKYGKKNKNICILVADISPAGSIIKFRKKYPDRFINTGVAEQSMIGISAGLALKGMKPFCYTIATFAFYRPFEMIRVDLCYQNLPVTIVGMGTGTVYSTLGGTHITQEDISISRSLPNLKIITPLDPYELEKALIFCIKNKTGPIYLRIGKVGEGTYNFKDSEEWKFGKIRKIVNGKKICFLTYGTIISKVYQLREKLKKNKFVGSIYSCHTIKPFDRFGINKIFKKYKNIVIIEDNSEVAGLGFIVKSLAFEMNFKGRIITYGLKDSFIHCYGTQEDLLNKHGLNFDNIYKDMLKL